MIFTFPSMRRDFRGSGRRHGGIQTAWLLGSAAAIQSFTDEPVASRALNYDLGDKLHRSG